MPALTNVTKRVFVGRPIRSDRAGEQLLPKRLALPIFASDPLSSVTYATQEILIILAVGGTALLYLTPWLAIGVVVLLAVLVASYRQLVMAYPSGGADYEVASKNLGSKAGMTVASALMVDYVLTVAVSISAGVDNVISAFPELHGHRVLLAAGFVVFLTAANLRGLRESGKVFAVPTYGFVLGIFVMVVTGVLRYVFGDAPVAESADYGIRAEDTDIAGAALVFFALRAFASGCTALTGVEAIANGVPAFRPPKSRNAARTLLSMGLLSMGMFGGITALAVMTDVRIVHDTCDLIGFRGDCENDPQRTVVAQLASAVFGDGSIGFFYVQAMAAMILILAANTAFNGFPLLGSVLAQDRLLPRQLHTRGDRLVFSNGILLLAGAAILLIWTFEASVTRLIQLYIIGVFTAFTLGQIGMVRHWNRHLATETDAGASRTMQRARIINITGAVMTGLVLVIVTVTKFTHGAYLVIIAMPVLFLLMRKIAGHYDDVSAELKPAESNPPLPSRNRAIVLVSKLHSPTLRAVSYARATRPHDLSAVTVNVDPEDTLALQAEWDRRNIPVPLVVIDSPYREITKPVLDYVTRLRGENPRDVVTVFIPEYVVGRWWEQILHNQSALRLKSRLLFQPGVMVTSVPYQLRSSERVKEDAGAPGDVRRARVDGAEMDAPRVEESS